MLISGLFLIQLIAVLSAYFLLRRGMRLIYPWLLLTFVGFMVWLVLFLISPGAIQPLQIQNWFRNDFSPIHLNFSITDLNWGLILAFLSMQLAFLLTTVADKNYKYNSIYWIILCLETTIAYAVLTSSNLFTLILLWTTWDVFEMNYWIFFRHRFAETTILRPFVFKLAGSLILVMSAAILTSNDQSVLLGEIPASIGIILLIASILHSGIILQPDYKNHPRHIDNAADSLVSIFAFFSSMALIAYLPFQTLPLIIHMVFQLLMLGVMISLGIRWLRNQARPTNSQILLAFFASFAVFQYLSNSLWILQNWFVAMFVIISFTILYHYRNKSTRLFPTLMLLLISGIPFSLLSYKNHSIFLDNPFLLIASFIFHVIIIAGYSRNLYLERESLDDIDSLPQFIYLAGLFIPLLTMIGMTVHSMGSLLDETSSWWMGLIILLVALGVSIWMRKKRLWEVDDGAETPDQKKQRRKFPSLAWIIDSLEKVILQIRPFILGFSQLVEGEGGVLWSIVFLALLLTLLRAR